MQNPSDELEKIFQQRFQNFEAPVPDDAFEMIQTQLAAARPQSNKRWYLMAAALLLLISTCTYFKVAPKPTANNMVVEAEAKNKETNTNSDNAKTIFDNSKNIQNIQNTDNQYFGKEKIQTNEQKNTLINEGQTSIESFKNKKNTSTNKIESTSNQTEKTVNNNINTVINDNIQNAQIVAFEDLQQKSESISEPIFATKNTEILFAASPTIQSLPLNPLKWNEDALIMIENVAINSITKRPKKQSPLTLDYTGAAIWTAYSLTNNTQDQILINEIVVPKGLSAQRLGLRLGFGANLALSKKLSWHNRLSLQVSQLSVQYASKEVDYTSLITARVAQSIVVQPSIRTVAVTQQQTQFVATVQSGLRYKLLQNFSVNADLGYQHNQSFKAGRLVSTFGADYGFRSKQCTYAIGPFMELPLTGRNFSFQDALYFNPTYIGFQLRVGR